MKKPHEPWSNEQFKLILKNTTLVVTKYNTITRWFFSLLLN
jgi:hypothetical protein